MAEPSNILSEISNAPSGLICILPANAHALLSEQNRAHCLQLSKLRGKIHYLRFIRRDPASHWGATTCKNSPPVCVIRLGMEPDRGEMDAPQHITRRRDLIGDLEHLRKLLVQSGTDKTLLRATDALVISQKLLFEIDGRKT